MTTIKVSNTTVRVFANQSDGTTAVASGDEDKILGGPTRIAGPQGPQGPEGPEGPAGPEGTVDVLDLGTFN